MGKIIDFSSGTRKLERRRKTRDKQIRKEGAEALKALRRTKLSWEDRVSIARHLHDELDRLFQGQPELERGEFAIRAGLAPDGKTSKQLWYLTLAKGENREKKLRASGSPYASLIEALGEVTGENIHQLIDRITAGTKVHPSRIEYKDKDEKVRASLQRLANQIDQEFSLLEKFKLTAEQKIRHLKAGGANCWPFSACYDLYDQRESFHFDLRYSYYSPKQKGHWLRWPEPEVMAFLPHAHIGMYWDDECCPDAGRWWDEGLDNYAGTQGGPGGVEAKQGWFLNKTKYDANPRHIEIDEKTGQPFYNNRGFCHPHLDFWLVLYPNPQENGIEPMLWSHGCDYTEGGMAHFETITSWTLEELRKTPAISRVPKSLYDSLFELLDASSGTCRLLSEWRRTASYVEHNPFYGEVKKDQREHAILDAILCGEEPHETH